MSHRTELEKYFRYIVKTATKDGGEFNNALILATAKECLAIVQDAMRDIPDDEKWTPMSVAESLELRIADHFHINLYPENTDEQQATTSTDDSNTEQQPV